MKSLAQRGLLPVFAVLIPAGRAQDLPSPLGPPPAVLLSQRADLDLTGSKVTPGAVSLHRWGPVNVRPHFNASVTYGNGVNAAPGQATKTATMKLSPGALFELGNRWTLDYTPTFSFYSSDAFRDQLDHSVILNGGTSYRNWSFGLSQIYSQTSEPLDETARQTPIENFATSLSASYYFSSQWMLQMGVNQNFRFSEDLNNSKNWSTMEWLNYQLSPSLSMGVGAGGGYDNVSRGSDMTFASLRGRVSAKLAEKLNLDINGGMENRRVLEGGVDDMLNPVYGAEIQYRIFSTTTLSLAGNRATEASLFDNQVTDTKRISLALNQRVLGAAYLLLSGGYDNTTYLSTQAGVGADRSDDSISFMASLSYSFIKRSTTSIFFSYRKHNSNQGGFAYDTTEIGLNFGYGF